MINFFRRIRNVPAGKAGKMADDNRPLKYARYAVGEIILVVIGILIALQINNWNEQRKERIQEKIFLKRFDAELNTNLENILTAISLNKSRIHRAEFLLRTINRPELVLDSSSYFMKSIEHAGYTNIPLISDNAFEELKSSGNLSLIRNETLRAALQKYYSWTTNEGQYNFLQQDIQLNYFHLKQGIFTTSQVIDMGDYFISKNYSSTEAKETFERMMNKSEFLKFIPYIIQNKLMVGNSYDYIHDQAKALKLLLKAELDKKNED
ncbi:DUF6090 family protein [Namhaeicola litoreus]|uniref:DUF6090 family protein n=1 Tax=Namhaeicola litoreus TaxID=1052145 RepID=A0ABW3Y433_9FLAO